MAVMAQAMILLVGAVGEVSTSPLTSSLDPDQSLAERKLSHEIKMDEKREARDHELQLKSEEAQIAVAETKSAFIGGLFAAAQEHQAAATDDEKTEEPTVQPPIVEPRQTAVIS